MSAILFSRAIGPVPITCVVSESHTSEIDITSNPIETGAEVHDHAYILPKRVTLDIGDSRAAATFAALMQFQESRVPFTLVTGLSVYRNMLIKAINADRDRTNAYILRATVELQEVIIVDTAFAADAGGADGSRAGQPGGSNSTQQARPNPTRSGDPATADRASGTVQSGDASATPVNRSVAKAIGERLFGP